jgi:NAD(P)-dependent dehydrogenase (short-subunit alcohol dehydrogenase family)
MPRGRSLDGKVALITGASQGVGFAAAEAFAAAGCDVAVVARGKAGLDKSAARVRRYGRRAVVLPADVTDQEEMDAAVGRCVAELGALDVLVPNAAATVFGPFDQVSKEQFDKVVDVTFHGYVNVIRAGLPQLQRSGGVVVATGSINSKLPLPTWTSYCAAKWAQRGFLHSLRLELEAQGSPVDVAIAHSGQVNTPVWETTTTATGVLPRKPPEGYRPEVIAAELVELARNPRPEVTVGLEAKVIESMWQVARPLGDLFWKIVYHYNLSGRDEISDTGALLRATSRGVAEDGLPVSRPSLTRPLRVALSPLKLLQR